MLVEAGSEPHHLAQPVDDRRVPLMRPGHHHVETVGAEIDRGKDLRGFDGGCGFGIGQDHRPSVSAYTENEEPQPQVVVAFGLRMMNCAPDKSSR